jgi:hypothetical protein
MRSLQTQSWCSAADTSSFPTPSPQPPALLALQAKKIVLVAEADLDKVKGKFPDSDIAVMPGYDGQALSRILGKQRSAEYSIEPLLPGQQKVVSAYYWGTDPAMYYVYAPQDPLYFWKVAGLVSGVHCQRQ